MGGGGRYGGGLDGRTRLRYGTTMRTLTWLALLLGAVALTWRERLPEDWAAQIFLPLLLGLYTIGLGFAEGLRAARSCDRGPAEADAEGHSDSRSRQQRRVVLRASGMTWLVWTLVAAGPFGLLLLDRLDRAASGSLLPFPLAGALVYPAGLLFAFALAFRRQADAGVGVLPLLSRFRLWVWAAAPLLLLESLPRSLYFLHPRSSLWPLRPAGLIAPPALLSAALVVALVVIGRRLLWGSTRGALPQGPFESSAAAGPGGAVASPLVRERAGLLALGAAFLLLPWWRAYRQLDHDFLMDVLRLATARDSYLAIDKARSGAIGLASFIRGDRAYVSMERGIGIYDISDPARPRLMHRLMHDSGLHGFGTDARFFEGPHGRVYVGMDQGLWLVDERDVRRPRLSFASAFDNLTVVNGLPYGWISDWRLGLQIPYLLDARRPFDLRPLLALPLAEKEEVTAGLPAPAPAADHEDLVVIVPWQGSGALRVLLLRPGQPGRLAEGRVALPPGADLLAVKDGMAYLQTADSFLVMALTWGEAEPLRGSVLARLNWDVEGDLGKPDPARQDGPRTSRKGTLRDGRLLFVSGYDRAINLVDVSDPRQPRLLFQDRTRSWETDIQWSADGLVSALARESKPCSVHPGRSATWHLMRMEPSGSLSLLAARPSAVYRSVVRAGEETWVLADCRGIRRVEDGPPPLDMGFDPLRNLPVQEREAVGYKLKGRGLGFWVHGNRWCRTVADGLSCQDRDAGRPTHFGGPRTRSPRLAAADERYLVMTHVGGVMVLDLGEARVPAGGRQPLERLALDWADPDLASQPRIEEMDWRRGYYEPGPWADLVAGRLLVLSDGGTLFRWQLGAWAEAPEAIPIPAPLDEPHVAGLRPDDRRREASWDLGGRLLIEDILPELPSAQPYAKRTQRIVDLHALPELRLRPCTFADTFVPVGGRPPTWTECNGLDVLAAMILRRHDGQVALAGPREVLIGASATGAAWLSSASVLKVPAGLKDLAWASVDHAVVVTEQGDLLHVERRPVARRFVDALLGRVVTED